MFYKSVANTVREGEIARDEQFLLFPHCFQKKKKKKTRKSQGLFGKGLKQYQQYVWNRNARIWAKLETKQRPLVFISTKKQLS